MDPYIAKPFARGEWKVAGLYESKMAELPKDDL